MDKSIFTFELVDKYTPDVVIKNSLKQIDDATRGYVIGEIMEYGGPISSYTKTVGLASALGALQTSSETVDIQKDLGELDKEDHRYEVFLTVKDLQHYKYRMMFVRYSSISYPATIVMNEDLAIEYSGQRNTKFIFNSMDELKEMIESIINSHTIISLIQSMINESLRQEEKRINQNNASQEIEE